MKHGINLANFWINFINSFTPPMDRILEKKKWPPRRIATISALGVLPVLATWLLIFRDNRSTIIAHKDHITMGKVVSGNFQEFIPVDGVVQPILTIFIDAAYGGKVEEIFFRDGAMVQKGQPISRLSNALVEKEYMFQENQALEVRNNYQNTRLNIERTKFALDREMADLEYQKDLAEADFNRKKNLFSQGHISQEDFENAQRDYRIALRRFDISFRALQYDSVYTRTQMVQIKESIDRMQHNIRVLSENLKNLTITAPIARQLSSFRAEIGETRQPGQNLGQIDVLNGFKLKARIDERYITRTHPGQRATFVLGGKDYLLEVRKIYSNITSGTFEVDLFFISDTPEGLIRGQTIQLRLEFSASETALIIPRGGFFQQTGGNWIYVVDPSGSFAEKRLIRIGRQKIHSYEVLEGLHPGETVIVSSYDTFGARDKVLLKHE